MSADPRFSVNLTTELDAPAAAEREQGPFRIAILGDFSGRTETSSGAAPVAGRRAWRVDRDDLDAAIAGIRPALRLRLLPELDPVVISFASIDDFHPDVLVDRVTLFRQLRGLEAAAPRPTSEPKRDLPSTADARATAASLSGASGGSLLDEIVGAQSPEPTATQGTRPRDDLSAFIDQAVRQHLVQEPSAQERDLAKQTEELLSAALRVLLHHPAFQAVESLWRAVDLLVRRVETGETAEIYLFDVTKEEVLGDVAGIQQMLMAHGRSWSLLAAAHTYAPEDARALASVAALGKRLGAPCVAGASPSFAGVESFAQSPDEDDWTFASSDEFHTLRGSSEASFLSLVLPRFLARESYGKKGVTCERIAFEEFPSGERDHASLLWANGAILCALAIGARVAEGDPPPTRATIDGLPLEIATVDGEAIAIPCAEGQLGQSEVERLLDQGLTPLACMRDSATVIIPRIQSVAEPPRPLPIRTY